MHISAKEGVETQVVISDAFKSEKRSGRFAIIFLSILCSVAPDTNDKYVSMTDRSKEKGA
jgi:hypothetical protein